MPKPDRLPLWDPPDGVCLDPPEALARAGWRPKDRPGAQHLNAWQRRVYRWLGWLDVITTDHAADLAVMPDLIEMAAIEIRHYLNARVDELRTLVLAGAHGDRVLTLPAIGGYQHAAWDGLGAQSTRAGGSVSVALPLAAGDRVKALEVEAWCSSRPGMLRVVLRALEPGAAHELESYGPDPGEARVKVWMRLRHVLAQPVTLDEGFVHLVQVMLPDAHDRVHSIAVTYDRR